MLIKNFAFHKLENVTALKLALGRQLGDVKEKIFRIWGKRPECKKYSFTTIDHFIESYKLSQLDCIKIDVDSFDFEVLQGAQNVLLKHNPFIMVELNHALAERNQSNMQALEWLAKLGYNQAVVFDYDNFLLKRNFNLEQYTSSQQNIAVFF